MRWLVNEDVGGWLEEIQAVREGGIEPGASLDALADALRGDDPDDPAPPDDSAPTTDDPDDDEGPDGDAGLPVV